MAAKSLCGVEGGLQDRCTLYRRRALLSGVTLSSSAVGPRPMGAIHSLYRHYRQGSMRVFHRAPAPRGTTSWCLRGIQFQAPSGVAQAAVAVPESRSCCWAVRFESKNPGPDEEHGNCHDGRDSLPLADRQTDSEKPARRGAGEEQRSTRPKVTRGGMHSHSQTEPTTDHRPPTDRPTDRRTGESRATPPTATASAARPATLPASPGSGTPSVLFPVRRRVGRE